MGNSDLTYSGIVYLFADQFVEKANIFDSDEFISDNRVKKKQLAEMLCLASLLYLMDKNIINLEIIEIEKKFFLISYKEKVTNISKKNILNVICTALNKKFLKISTIWIVYLIS